MAKTMTNGRVLIVAGSDSGGGAGIQADIKSCAAFGAYSMTAITAITAQNTVGVQALEPVSAALVQAQMESCLTDIGADVIKIGMLATEEIIHTVADTIDRLGQDCFVVLDPVMIATSGDRLLAPGAVEALKSRLVPRADVITPNVPEAEALTGLSIKNTDDLQAAGAALIKQGVFAAFMKGGHLSGPSVIDIVVSEDGAQIMSGPRLFSRHTHGTGCTLASALAAQLALDVPLDRAAVQARDFVFQGIDTAPGFGSGGKDSHGPLNHGLAIESEDAASPAGEESALAKAMRDALKN